MIPFEEWAGLNQIERRRMARDPEIKPLKYRVMFAAEGWANLIGHAEFAPGGLALVLQTANPQTGELNIPSRQRVANAVREAIDSGLVATASTARCLVVSPEMLAKTGGHGGRSCRFHRIRARNSVASPETDQAQKFTSPVNPDLQKFTSPVNPVHVSRELLSEDRPISDLFLPGAPAPDPDAKTPHPTERKSA